MDIRIAVGAQIDGKADELVVRAVHRALRVKWKQISDSSVNILICEENCHSIAEQRLSLQLKQSRTKTWPLILNLTVVSHLLLFNGLSFQQKPDLL